MKAYVLTTGMLFGLLVAAHVWRAVEEGAGVLRNPWFLAVTIAGALLCLWAWRVFRLLPRS